MVIVVQTFTSGQECQPLQVAGTVRIGATAEVMSHTVHRGRGGEIQTGVNHRRCQASPGSDRRDQQGDADGQTHEGSIEEPTVPAIGREIPRVLRDETRFTSGSSVQRDVGPLDPPPSEQDGGVRITVDIGVSVMLPVHGDPLPRTNSRRDPHQRTAHATNGTRENERAVRETPVQVHGRDQIRQHRGRETGDDCSDDRHHDRKLARWSESPNVREYAMDPTQETDRSRLFAPVDATTRERWMKFGKWDRVYFPQLVGIVVDEVRQDYCRMSMPFRPELEQPMGIVHGGAIATLLDVVLVPAIGTGLEPEAGYSTVDMHVRYLSALVGETAIAEGWVVKRGRSLVFCEAEIVGASTGKTIASASLTYFLVRSRSGS